MRLVYCVTSQKYHNEDSSNLTVITYNHEALTLHSLGYPNCASSLNDLAIAILMSSVVG